MPFGVPHPETLPGECWVGNILRGDVTQYAWKSKRFGKIAYDWEGLSSRYEIPVFVARSELLAAGIKVGGSDATAPKPPTDYKLRWHSLDDVTIVADRGAFIIREREGLIQPYVLEQAGRELFTTAYFPAALEQAEAIVNGVFTEADEWRAYKLFDVVHGDVVKWEDAPGTTHMFFLQMAQSNNHVQFTEVVRRGFERMNRHYLKPCLWDSAIADPIPMRLRDPNTLL